MFAALWAALASGVTYAKVALALLEIARSFLEKADKRELEDQGYRNAVADSTALTLKVVGLSAKAFQERAGWTDEQIIDDLTKPPQPRPSP